MPQARIQPPRSTPLCHALQELQVATPTGTTATLFRKRRFWRGMAVRSLSAPPSQRGHQNPFVSANAAALNRHPHRDGTLAHLPVGQQGLSGKFPQQQRSVRGGLVSTRWLSWQATQSHRPTTMGKRKDQSGYDQDGRIYSWVHLNRCGHYVRNRHRETLAVGTTIRADTLPCSLPRF